MRPAWPDELPRVRALVGDLFLDALRVAGVNSEEYFVLVKEHPVERLVGVMAWGQQRADSGTVFFICWVLPAYQASAVGFLRGFRCFVIEENAGRFHSLSTAPLFPEGAPQLALLAEAGFVEGLVNQTYAFKFSVGLVRTARSRQRFGHRNLPLGSRLVAPEKAHLPSLCWLCCDLHDLIAPSLLNNAFEGGDTAGFDPAYSVVYLEGDQVQGTLLSQRCGDDVKVTARVVAPQASAPAGLVCQKMFERWTELVGTFNPLLVHLHANPAVHGETVRLALRYGGWRTGRMVRMEARRARQTHAFCIGNARCGTTTLAALLHGPLLSNHEPERAEFIRALQRWRNGKMSTAEMDAFLLDRDRRLGLEFESSTFLFFVLDRLVALFPQARFVTLVRHPAEWVDSLFRYLHSGKMPADSRAFLSEVMGADAITEDDAESLLRFWNHHLQRALDVIPPERHLVLETATLDENASRALAGFLQLPHLATLCPGRHNVSGGKRNASAWEHLIPRLCPLWPYRANGNYDT